MPAESPERRTAYLPKPFDTRVLSAKVHELVASAVAADASSKVG